MPSAGARSRKSFYGHLAQAAADYSVWGDRKLHLADAGELESRSEEISWAAERIVSRASDDFLGHRFEDLLDRSEGTARFRRAVDYYTSVTLRSTGAALGAEPGAPVSGAGRDGRSSSRGAMSTTARLQVDLHPKIIVKTRFRSTQARLEVPLSRSEYRFTLSRPLNSRVSSELFAAYPGEADGHPRAGVHIFWEF